ncbi:cryptochrome-2 [alpha proteobacterium Q-1]|nr:cryptochrome-2 [alpha proteobacterium Q-1]
MKQDRPVLLWFRQDLRLSDHPALQAAIGQAMAQGGPVIAVYIWDQNQPDDSGWAMGSASRWWLHHSLQSLGRDLEKCGGRLIIRQGDPAAQLMDLVAQSGATALHATRMIEPYARTLDHHLAKSLPVPLLLHDGAFLHPPGSIRTQQGGGYKVFSQFWKAVLKAPEPDAPLPAPERGVFAPPTDRHSSLDLNDLSLLPRVDWAAGLSQRWLHSYGIGEDAAAARLDDFLDDAVAHYKHGRDFPAEAFTSSLSPHLHFGEISPRQIWHRAQMACERADTDRAGTVEKGVWAFLREVGWRDFAGHLLAMIPDLPDQPMRPQFQSFPWGENEDHLRAWQRGQTGYPIVDAGMRELWHTGFMHNRVRMITASFLIKHLMIDWRQGERWFWDTLVDADLANNSMGWQWVAGSGPDASPYFRIFNPITQGQRFDPEGQYVRRYVPELADLPAEYIHAPWEAPPMILQAAGVSLGQSYPHPMIDHRKARARALAGYEKVKTGL